MKKISWGTGILVSILLFMSLTIFTGVFLMNQKVDLVAEDYYAKEIKYQQHIDMLERTKKLKNKLHINFNGNLIIISADDELKKSDLNGKINFYRPSDKNDDSIIELKLDEDGSQRIKVNNLTKGFWRVNIVWQLNGETYFSERAFTIE